jgi:hypothetical protein
VEQRNSSVFHRRWFITVKSVLFSSRSSKIRLLSFILEFYPSTRCIRSAERSSLKFPLLGFEKRNPV